MMSSVSGHELVNYYNFNVVKAIFFDLYMFAVKFVYGETFILFEMCVLNINIQNGILMKPFNVSECHLLFVLFFFSF